MLTIWIWIAQFDGLSPLRRKDVDVRELVQELFKEGAVRVLAAVAEEDASSSRVPELDSSRDSTS